VSRMRGFRDLRCTLLTWGRNTEPIDTLETSFNVLGGEVGSDFFTPVR
jgi:hypothetical protein